MYIINSFSKVISSNFLNHCEVLSLKIYITFITELEHEHRILGSKYSSHFVVVQLLSCDQLCPTLSSSMDCSMPGFPVLHYLPELAQTHVHWFGDAIQPSHPLTPFSSCPQCFPALGSFPVSQPFTSGGQSIGASASALVLPMNTQGWFSLGLTGLISLLSKGCPRVFPSTTVWKHQFFSAQPS